MVGVVGSITFLQCVKKKIVLVQFYAGAKCGMPFFLQPAWEGEISPSDTICILLDFQFRQRGYYKD